LDLREPSIIVKNAGDITGIFLMMDQNPQAKDIVTMGYV